MRRRLVNYRVLRFDQAVREQLAEVRHQLRHLLRRFDKLDPHRHVFARADPCVRLVHPVVRTEAGVGPHQTRPRHPPFEQECENLPVEEILACRGILVEMDRDLLRWPNIQHRLKPRNGSAWICFLLL